jgi:hypothetical protein
MNPLQTLTKVVGFGFQQGASLLGKAVSTVQGITGRGGGPQEQERQPSGAEQQRQRQQQAASRRRASRQPKPMGDVAITRKVETELFRSSKVAKGKIDVNTADGIVWLRGEAKTPEQIKDLEAKAAAIPEVKRVENLLHLPSTPAPTRTDTPAAQRKTRASKPSAASRRVTPARTTSESASTVSSPAEPAPSEIAGERSGRPAAPLGGDGESGPGNGGGPSAG